jgi:hypothetical protein
MTIIVPVNINSITLAVKEMWLEDMAIGGAGVQIDRYEEMSKAPGEHGWAGIYRARVDYPPRALGMSTGYRQQLIRLLAMVCESDPTSGEECGERLDLLLQKLVGTLLSDPSLKGTVQTLDEFSVEYFDYQRQSETGMYLQYAQLNFTGVIPVSAI